MSRKYSNSHRLFHQHHNISNIIIPPPRPLAGARIRLAVPVDENVHAPEGIDSAVRPEVEEGNVRHLERRQSPAGAGGTNRLGRHVGDGRRRLRADARIIRSSRRYGGVVGYHRRIDQDDDDAGRSEIIGGHDQWGRRDSEEVGDGAGDGGLHR